MKNRLQNILYMCLLLMLAMAGMAAFSLHSMRQPGDFSQDTHVIIRKGMGSRDVVESLGRAGVLRFPTLFYVVQMLQGNLKKLKAGEYEFAAHSTPQQLVDKLISGEVVIHKITIPEGWTVREVRAALIADTVLEGEITRAMAEGSILPETYHYIYGDTRDDVVARMQALMEKELDRAWNQRAEGLPLASKQEALVLASIVEKETGVADERARVAAVFINRLRKGMKLQTDPSVVYGIEQQLGTAMRRELTRADIETATAYNTYVIAGLPPTPIANPGREAIAAALHPEQSDALYFVATGRGGHYFSRTLEQHNANVAAYRNALANASAR